MVRSGVKIPMAFAALGAAVVAAVVTLGARQTMQRADATMTRAALPADVYPDSYGRLPTIKKSDLDAQGQKDWDFLQTEYAKRGGQQFRNGFTGPWNMRMYDPHINVYTYELRYYLGNETPIFGKTLTELAILVAAREVSGVGNVFEFTNHDPGGRKLLGDALVDVVKYRKPVTGLGEKEACVIKYGRELIGPTALSSATFAQCRALFGDKGVVQLTELLGQYVAMAMVNKAFDMHNRPEQDAVRASVAAAFAAPR